MHDMPTRLIAPDEPCPVTVTNAGGSSPLVIVADHAGNDLPRRLQNLGLGPEELERHIAWDIGVGAVSRPVGAALHDRAGKYRAQPNAGRSARPRNICAVPR
jgi:predicted N-formylglutamate amidohydrolase